MDEEQAWRNFVAATPDWPDSERRRVWADRPSPVPRSVPLTVKPSGDKKCVCVKFHVPKPNILHSHHVWPLGEGGPNVSANLLWLCLPGNMPVTMGNGSHLNIKDVVPGDIVFGHDGLPHHVTGVKLSRSTELIVRLDDLLLTADHLVFTRSGWLPAGALRKGDEVCRLQVLGEGMNTHVLSLVPTEPEVFDSVVVGDQINVVDDFSPSEFSTDRILHDEACPLHFPTLVAVPYDDDDVSLIVEPSATLALSGTRHALQGAHSAIVPAEFSGPAATAVDLRRELSSTFHAGVFDGLASAVNRSTHVGTRGVGVGQRRRRLEVFIAGGTRLHDKTYIAATERRWDALTHVEHALHDGELYDISIAGSQSFVAGGIAVHNCPTTHNNVHELWRLYDKFPNGVPPALLRPFSRYVRAVVRRGRDQKMTAQVKRG